MSPALRESIQTVAIKQCSTVSTIDGKPCLLHDKHVGSCNFNDELSAATGTVIHHEEGGELFIHLAPKVDMVSHPPHYTGHPSGIECITVTRHMGFNLGNAIKYLWRADLKNDAIEDMKKAIWYIQDEINKRSAVE